MDPMFYCTGHTKGLIVVSSHFSAPNSVFSLAKFDCPLKKVPMMFRSVWWLSLCFVGREAYPPGKLTYPHSCRQFWFDDLDDFPNFPFGGICFLVPWRLITALLLLSTQKGDMTRCRCRKFGERPEIFSSNHFLGSKQNKWLGGGGFTNTFYVHPDPWGNDGIWRAYFFKPVETTN